MNGDATIPDRLRGDRGALADLRAQLDAVCTAQVELKRAIEAATSALSLFEQTPPDWAMPAAIRATWYPSQAQRAWLQHLVREVVATMPVKFSSSELRRALSIAEPRVSERLDPSSLNRALKKLVADGEEIEILENGRGKRATTFRRLEGQRV